jgi:hypothetical protein
MTIKHVILISLPWIYKYIDWYFDRRNNSNDSLNDFENDHFHICNKILDQWNTLFPRSFTLNMIAYREIIWSLEVSFGIHYTKNPSIRDCDPL